MFIAPGSTFSTCAFPLWTHTETIFNQKLTTVQILQSQGKYQDQPPHPFVLGSEFAGTIVAVPQESSYKPGDRVFGVAQGAYGERIVAKPHQVQPLPDALSFDQGASMCQKSPMISRPNNY